MKGRFSELPAASADLLPFIRIFEELPHCIPVTIGAVDHSSHPRAIELGHRPRLIFVDDHRHSEPECLHHGLRELRVFRVGYENIRFGKLSAEVTIGH